MKAYDLKVLTEKLKSRGLDLAEDSAKIVAEELFAWIKESAGVSETPYDDMALLILPQLEKIAFESIDKIDGKIDA